MYKRAHEVLAECEAHASEKHVRLSEIEHMGLGAADANDYCDDLLNVSYHVIWARRVLAEWAAEYVGGPAVETDV